MTITYLRRIRQSLCSTRSLQTQRLGDLIVPCLQIEPVPFGHAEVMCQAVGDVGINRALALDDFVYSPGRDLDDPRKADLADSLGR
jgi:hypothetical protein